MTNERRVRTLKRCINQLVRPKIYVPRFIRPEGCGDCTKCKPHSDNLKCSCYTPVDLIKIREKRR